jgi:hypothetical protein
MRKALLSAAAIAIVATVSACAMTEADDDEAIAQQATMAPPGGDYQMVSELVALPEFIPGLGTLYVQPDTLPAGPFLAYDRSGKLVSTIYMVPLDDIEAQQKFDGLEVGENNVDSVDMYYNAGHPGVEEPHYHVVLWHVPEDEAQLQ